MSFFSELMVRARSLLRRDVMEREMAEEMQYHLEREEERFVRDGHSCAEARRRARALFGGVDAAREGVRDERGTRWIEDSVRDARLGLRALTRRPLYWFTAAFTLGLGIAATTAIYSLVSMVLLRPLDAAGADRLVVFGQSGKLLGSPTPSISYPTLRDIRNLDVFAGAIAFSTETFGARDATHEETTTWWAHAVTGNYFTLLGLQPALGRLFTEADEGRREHVAVLSHSFWTRRYGANPGIIGSAVQINGIPFTIIGIAPEGWRGLEPLTDPHAYLPLTTLAIMGSRSADSFERRGSDFLRAVALLQPGRDLSDARASLRVLADRIAPERGEKPGEYSIMSEYELRARPVIVISGFIPAIASVFLGLALLALLIACVNVGHLVLSRTVARAGELAVRRALGASRARVARELLSESALLGISALAVAVPVAWLVITWISNLQLAVDVPVRIDARMDRSVLAFSGSIAILAGLVTGIVPALRGSAQVPGTALREAAGRTSGSVERRRLGSALLVGQLAFSLVLVIAGALFMRSLQSITSLDLGFDPDQVVMASVDLSLSQYSESRAQEFYRRASEGMAALPGVVAVGHVADAHMGFSQRFRGVRHLDGRPIGELSSMSAQVNSMTPGAFTVLRYRVREGRAFDRFDDSTAPRRAIINEVLARRMWPELTQVVGKRFRLVNDSTPLEVVGVVHPVKSEFPTEQPVPQVFFPYAQEGGLSRTMFLRVAGAPDQHLPAVRRVLRDIDPAAAVANVVTMHAFLHEGKAFFLYRLGSALTTAIGLLGLLQTLVGLYGVIASAVGQRAREFGIRLALGARSGQLVRGVMAPAAWQVGAGALLGVVGAALLLPAAASVLAVSPRDPLTYASCTAGLVMLGLIALYLPARRAARTGPMRALRSD